MTDQLITELLVIPDNMEWTDANVSACAIRIRYQGTYTRRSAENLGDRAWYSVEHMASSLSRANNWFFCVDRFQRWQYRFEYEDALARAHEQVNHIKINGRTWAEWKEQRANRG